MITIETPNALPYGWLMMYSVEDEAEAMKIAAGRTSYFYKSNIVDAFYLFVPVEDK